MMSSLIKFVRALAEELNREADVLTKQSRQYGTQQLEIAALTMRSVSAAITAAAKSTLLA